MGKKTIAYRLKSMVDSMVMPAAAKTGIVFGEHAVKVASRQAQAAKAIYGIDPKKGTLTNLIENKKIENMKLAAAAIREYGEQVQDIIANASMDARVEDVTKDLIDRAGVSSSRAELIARDQTLKLNGDINRENQQSAGITKYVWSTSGDERVRDSHAELEGEEFEWGERVSMDPPEPGQDFQCRCVGIPIVEEINADVEEG